MEHNIENKVGVFIIVVTLLIITAVGYVAYKKDMFSRVYTYTLKSDTGENITKGMPVLFWGFNIGKVNSMELTDTGVLVKIKIPERNNKVIRTGSQFMLDSPLLGSPRIIVNTPDLNATPLSEDVTSRLTITDDINKLIKSGQTIADKMSILVDGLTDIIGNITSITDNVVVFQGNLNRIMDNTEKMTANYLEKDSLVEMITGDPKSAEDIRNVIGNLNEVSGQVNELLVKVDTMVKKTDESVFDKEGVVPLIKDILKDVIKTLEDANRISGEAANATQDLTVLRNNVDETINAVRNLIDDLDRMIPFKEESGIELP